MCLIDEVTEGEEYEMFRNYWSALVSYRQHTDQPAAQDNRDKHNTWEDAYDPWMPLGAVVWFLQQVGHVLRHLNSVEKNTSMCSTGIRIGTQRTSHIIECFENRFKPYKKNTDIWIFQASFFYFPYASI